MTQLLRTRTIHLLRSRINILRKDANCINSSCPWRLPPCRSFLSCRPSFSSCGWQSENWQETSSRIQASTPTQQKTRTNTQNTPHNPIKTPWETGISILQVNINGITNTQEELKLAYTTQADIITIQETKLTTTSKIPKITNYTPVCTVKWSEVRRRTTHIH